jgi:hypothetical protein
MSEYITDDDRDRILQIIPSNELRLIPLYIIITHIYDNIFEKASNCELSYGFNIDKLIKNYGINTKIATPNNKLYIINEIKRLFPGIKITEIREKTTCSLYNSYLNACWEEELDDINDTDDVVTYGDNLETYHDDDDDIILKQAIQESLKEVKKTERPNNSIMCKKAAEERIKKSQEKYKKLYK